MKFTSNVIHHFLLTTKILCKYSSTKWLYQAKTSSFVARVFNFQANLSLYFWGECVLTATYIINLTPTHIFSGKSSYKDFFSTPSNYKKLCFFGCLCYVHRQPSHKFDCHARKYICFGYPYGKNELKVYDL